MERWRFRVGRTDQEEREDPGGAGVGPVGGVRDGPGARRLIEAETARRRDRKAERRRLNAVARDDVLGTGVPGRQRSADRRTDDALMGS
jgi:hypothetical protein